SVHWASDRGRPRGHRARGAAALPRPGRALPGRGGQWRHGRPPRHLRRERDHRQDDGARRLRRRQRPDVDPDDARRTRMNLQRLAFVLLTLLATPAMAQQVTMETLLDRIQIQDLLTRYYYDLAQGKGHELSAYFTEDAMLDVDGTI